MHKDVEDTVDRLITEIRQKDEVLESIKKELSRARCDLEALTVVGAVKRLVLDRDAAIKHADELEKELDKIVRKK